MGLLKQVGLANFARLHPVAVIRHPVHSNLIHLSYEVSSTHTFCCDINTLCLQIFSEEDNTSEVMRECRGLILDEADNWKVICFPARKIISLHERDGIDWSSVSVFEKVDGVPVSMYYFAGEWHLSSRCRSFTTLDALIIVQLKSTILMFSWAGRMTNWK